MSFSESPFRLGQWTVWPRRCTIESDATSTHVKPKSMAVLVRLADADGDVVSRNDLLDSVWPGSDVTDDVLTHCIVELRKAFDDSARDPEIIETVPKMGIRLLPPVRECIADAPSAPAGQALARQTRFALVVIGLAVIVASGIWLLHLTTSETDVAGPPSIEVWPFIDSSPALDQAHIANGLTESLAIKLGSLDGLNVVGGASGTRSRAFELSTYTIEDADPDYLLEGSVLRSDGSFRVTARLVDVESRRQLWATAYDRPFEDLFEVQDSISEAVARALSITLNVGHLRDIGTANVEAYEEFWLSQTIPIGSVDSVERSRSHLLRAVELDPDWALAWSELGYVYVISRFWYGPTYPWQELALDAFENANRIDADNPAVVLTSAWGFVAMGKWREAETAFRRLDQPNAQDPAASRTRLLTRPPPGYWVARLDLYAKTGRVSEVVEDAAFLVAQSPTSPNPLWAHFLGYYRSAQGQADDAMELLETAYLGGNPAAFDGLILALHMRDTEEIQKWLARQIDYDESLLDNPGLTVEMARLLGDREAALASLRSMMSPATYYDVAVWAAYYGDTELALEALRGNPDGWALWQPIMQEVRKTPGFAQLMHDVGLVDFWVEFGWGDFCSPSTAGEVTCQ